MQFADLIRELRIYGLEKQITNKQLQQNATHNSVMLMIPKLQSEYPQMVNKLDYLKLEPELKTAQTGPIAYFVGCAATLENVFEWNNIRYTDTARASIKLLNYAKIIPVVLENKCCGHDSYWAGDSPTAKKLAEFNVDLYKKAGVKTIVVSCGEGYRMWKHDYPQLVKKCDFEVKHITELLLEKGIFKRLNPVDSSPVKVTYHDPCRLGRLSGVYDPPRLALKALSGVELIEMAHNKEDAMCCGVGAFMACNSNWKLLRQMRIQEAVDCGAEYLVTTCPKCITHFTCYLRGLDEPSTEPAKAHKKTTITKKSTKNASKSYESEGYGSYLVHCPSHGGIIGGVEMTEASQQKITDIELEDIDQILQIYYEEGENLIGILQRVQEKSHFLPHYVLTYVLRKIENSACTPI